MTLSPFLRFAIVGALGFLVDIAVLWAGLNLLHLDPYSGRLLSFAVTVSFTWALNRHVTFGAARARTWRGMAHEWVRFVAVNSIGLAVNYVVYALLIGFGGAFFRQPIGPFVAAGAGSAAGLVFNYAASSRLVFGRRVGG